jgi:hypothetical protein
MQVGFGGLNIATPQEAERETERLAAAGVDVIKAHAGLTLEDYKAIVGAAHRHGIKVYAHVYAEQDVRHALDAGVDILQHVGSAGTAPPYSKELITDIVNAGRRLASPRRIAHGWREDTAAFPGGCGIGPGKRLSDISPRWSPLRNWWALGFASGRF